MVRRRPNVLVIMTDQHDPAVTGYSGDEVVDTRHLDALAARSATFPNAMCTSPICSPSRASFMTGKDVHRTGVWGNHWVIFPENLTMPAHFADNGYVTALVGKMHFGGRDQMQGFQHRPYGDLRHGLGHQPEPLDFFPAYMAAKSAGVTEIPESLIQDVVVTRETLAFVLEHADRDPETPWFTVAGYGRPHPPLTAPGRYLRRYRDRVPPPEPGDLGPDVLDPHSRRCYLRSRGDGLTEEDVTAAREAYYASIDFVDDCIGELLRGLDEAGALENTIVVYTADHGEMAGTHGIWNKTVFFDPSAGIPLLISVPGATDDGASVDAPISLMDLYPTLCGLAGIPVPEGLDGVDWSGTVRGEAEPPRAWVPCTFVAYGDRVGTGAQLRGTPGAAWRSVREKDWKYVEVRDDAPLLFDLANDPGELNNLAEDPAHAERCTRMRAQVFADFGWDESDRALAADDARVGAFHSGIQPTTPNQYQLPDGRIFDAEGALYGSRWLPIPPGVTGGIIPQRFG